MGTVPCSASTASRRACSAACRSVAWLLNTKSSASARFCSKWNRSATCTAPGGAGQEGSVGAADKKASGGAPWRAPLEKAPDPAANASRFGEVARDHLDTRVLAQPSGQRVCFAAGQQRHRAVPFEVHQHGAVGVALAQSPIVDAEHGRGHDGWHERLPCCVQQRVAACRKPKLAAEAHAG